MVGVAVNVTEAPAQVGLVPVVCAIETAGVTAPGWVIVKFFERRQLVEPEPVMLQVYVPAVKLEAVAAVPPLGVHE